MWFLVLIGLLSRFHQQSAEPESVGLYESIPSFMWEDSCRFIEDACITDDILLLMHKDTPYSEYSTIRCYELISGNMIWEIDSLKAEKYPLHATIADGKLFVCVHHPDSVTEAETEDFHYYYRFNQRAEDPGSSQYLLQCYNLNSGELVDQFVTGVLPTIAPPLISDGRIVILYADEVLCYGIEKGELLWNTDMNDRYSGFSWNIPADAGAERYAGSIILNQGTLYVGLKYSFIMDSCGELVNVFALSFDDGQVLWSTFQENGVLNGPVVHGDALYLYSIDTVSRRSARGGELEWERNYGNRNAGTDLWQHPLLWTMHVEGYPFVFWNGRMLVPRSGGGFSDSVDVVRLQDGTLERVIPVYQMQTGIYLLNGERGEGFLLSTETIDRSYQHLTLRTLPELERLWMYYLSAPRIVAGEGFVCALDRHSFRVFH